MLKQPITITAKESQRSCAVATICPHPFANGDLKNHPQLSGWRSPHMSVTRVMIEEEEEDFA